MAYLKHFWLVFFISPYRRRVTAAETAPMMAWIPEVNYSCLVFSLLLRQPTSEDDIGDTIFIVIGVIFLIAIIWAFVQRRIK